MNVHEAQTTRVVTLRKLLSPKECGAILSLAQEVERTDDEATLRFQNDVQLSQRGNWKTVYVHSGEAFHRQLPEIHDKLRAAIESADASEGWSLLTPPKKTATEAAGGGRGDVCVRTAEVHEVLVGGTLPEPKHYDAGSLITIDVMLSQNGEFDGGVFRTLELQDDGCSEAFLEFPEFSTGDAMVFVSHKYHGVAPVSRGVRRVCVVEFWNGEERSCPHRCKRRAGKCPYRRPAREAEESEAGAERQPPLRVAGAGGAAAAPPTWVPKQYTGADDIKARQAEAKKTLRLKALKSYLGDRSATSDSEEEEEEHAAGD